MEASPRLGTSNREKVSFLTWRDRAPMAVTAFWRPDWLHNNKGLETFARDAGPAMGTRVSSMFYLPGLSALFVLAASLLIGLV